MRHTKDTENEEVEAVSLLYPHQGDAGESADA